MSEPVNIGAGQFKMLLARIFGERMVSYDSGIKMIAYRWRGIIYVWKCELDITP